MGCLPVALPAVEDIRRMKTATNRPKDRAGLEELAALLALEDDLPPPGPGPAA